MNTIIEIFFAFWFDINETKFSFVKRPYSLEVKNYNASTYCNSSRTDNESAG